MTAPAWYFLRGSGVCRRWLNTLHWPYTLWHLSYVVIGAALAPAINWAVLGWTVMAFFLGMGISAHLFDLVRGDPLRLGFARRTLYVAGSLSLLAACAIGVWLVGSGLVGVQLVPLILVGIALVLGYNLEWPGMHGVPQFCLFWAAFPMIAGLWAQGSLWSPGLPLLLVFGGLTSWVQQVLSNRSKDIRRGRSATSIGDVGQLSILDRSLGILSFSMPVVAIGLLVL